jgi:hypothetical protein
MPSAAPTQSVRALLNRLIDYAGLFPPAKLDMVSTVRNYAEYLQGADAWMLGRLIVPVGRLDEFELAAADLLPRAVNKGVWQISALASAAGAPGLAVDVERIEVFNARHEEDDAGRAIIDVVELKADSSQAVADAMKLLSDDVFAFFEVPIAADPQQLIDAIRDASSGAKVRTGGVTADLYPTRANLARFIAQCASANVPFKATAGMHHPLRHFSDAVKTDEFGFVSVFIAACLALTDELDEAAIVQILEEREVSAFAFTDEDASWRGRRIDAESIEDVRAEFAIAFGSCSFDEPREDLRGMGLL